MAKKQADAEKRTKARGTSKAAAGKERVKSGKNGKTVGAVLVVGGGIAGMQASLDLSASGYKVYLLDRSTSIGGVMAQLDKTFPTNDCAMCIMAPKLVESGRHLNIEVITGAEITGLEGKAGDFKVNVHRKARRIDVEKCTGCGICARECPIDAIDVYNEGLKQRRAAYISYPQAVPLAYVIDKDKCIGCGLCENLCLADAVVYAEEDTEITLNVGAIILAPGFEEFDPKLRGEFGYGQFKNVITSIEFERVLSASGPYKGHVLRPSDGEIPTKVAFLQCVGSRDPAIGQTYCSSVCCMYAVKEAVIAREHEKLVEPTIFYMDMRSYGKGFDAYVERAEKEYGVRFVRCRVSRVEEDPKTRDLIVFYETEDGKLERERFGLVVLSVGLCSDASKRALAKTLGVELNHAGFAETDPMEPLQTSVPGIFVAGAFQGPKDIPETVAQASGAASKAGAFLSDSRGTLVEEKTYPKEIEVDGTPKIGVFVCHCGINIGGVVRVPEVVEYAKSLPDVVYVEENLYTCSQDTQEKITGIIREKGLNRVIVASCTPRTHEPLFQETLRDAGLNAYLFEMANIRDQCSWIHMAKPDKATEKAKDLVRMAVAKARLLEPLKRMELDVDKRVLIVGGGLAGMTAALELADQGFDSHIVEREAELGGILRDLHYTLEGKDVPAYLKDLVKRIESNPRITVHRETRVEAIDGFVGNFESTLVEDGSEEKVRHGAVIVATGLVPSKPKEYLYGKDKRVMTQLEFEDAISSRPKEAESLKDVVMIQCVGSRDEERPYCSRICCADAVKNALKLLELNPDARVWILYRDMRTYGFKEEYYEQAREKGVFFIRYEPERKPKVSKKDKKLSVKVHDIILDEDVEIEADALVLAAALQAPEGDEDLAKMLKVCRGTDDEFFLEAHVKLRPVDFATEGVFLAGMAHSPKFMDETISQACAAASRACTIISNDTYLSEPTIAGVDEDLCCGCGICKTVCEYGAIEIKENKCVVTEALCKGCGACAAACPSGAQDQRGFKTRQLGAMVDAALIFSGEDS
jgi:heterodisulfide reductase subunit A